MANKPSERRKGDAGAEIGEPDLTPIMNLTFMLILALLTMASILPIGLITVQAPQIAGGGGGGATPPPPTEKPLNLTIFVTLKGFNIAASGATLDGSTEGRPGEALFPKIKNEKGELVFDFDRLNAKLTQIKKSFPLEQKVIITADESILYEDIVKTMDASRESPDGEELFPAAAFAGGIVS